MEWPDRIFAAEIYISYKQNQKAIQKSVFSFIFVTTYTLPYNYSITYPHKA